MKTDIHGKNGQISQIPGLSPTIITGPAEKVQGRRTRVLDSDSDYVKLAKQGGRKGRAILLPLHVHTSLSLVNTFCLHLFLSLLLPCSTGLLWYDESITSKANSHKPPDCFITASEEDSKLYLLHLSYYYHAL